MICAHSCSLTRDKDMAKNSSHRWAVLFSRVHNPSINDSSSLISYWTTVAMEEKEFHIALIAMAAVSAKRRSRYAHSKNFYRDLDNFSTAVAHKTKPRRKILFSVEKTRFLLDFELCQTF